MNTKILDTDQKALEVNLNSKIYGALAEIGAGQEVARYFFKVGAAAGTIAKSMSAYDKVVSDDIYGRESKGRYVCESRLYKMLNHEYDLVTSRLQNQRPDATLFSFADTIAAINYSRTIKGSGWLGLRFQLNPNAEPNDLVLHVKMLDNDNILQQQAVGILGVNMIYGCYNYYDQPENLVTSLMDNLHGRIQIDLVRLTGPDFEFLDNRLICLWLVKHGLTEIAMFDANKNPVHASEFLYKHHVMVVRGSFRPATLVNQDIIHKSWKQFNAAEATDTSHAILMTELTFENLKISNNSGKVDEKDFLDRVDVLSAMGHTVVISHSKNYSNFTEYMADYKVPSIGIVIGVQELLTLITDKYYNNLDGRLLSAFGEAFNRNTVFYVYPALQEGSEELITTQNLPVPQEISFIYQHLLQSEQIVDVRNYDASILHIFSSDVLRMLKEDEPGWSRMVPDKIARLIVDKSLFGYPVEKIEFKY